MTQDETTALELPGDPEGFATHQVDTQLAREMHSGHVQNLVKDGNDVAASVASTTQVDTNLTSIPRESLELTSTESALFALRKGAGDKTRDKVTQALAKSEKLLEQLEACAEKGSLRQKLLDQHLELVAAHQKPQYERIEKIKARFFEVQRGYLEEAAGMGVMPTAAVSRFKRAATRVDIDPDEIIEDARQLAIKNREKYPWLGEWDKKLKLYVKNGRLYAGVVTAPSNMPQVHDLEIPLRGVRCPKGEKRKNGWIFKLDFSQEGPRVRVAVPSQTFNNRDAPWTLYQAVEGPHVRVLGPSNRTGRINPGDNQCQFPLRIPGSGSVSHTVKFNFKTGRVTVKSPHSRDPTRDRFNWEGSHRNGVLWIEGTRDAHQAWLKKNGIE
ncbi:hypothetical protein ACFL6C_12560 [Myxococcota bacterium]